MPYYVYLITAVNGKEAVPQGESHVLKKKSASVIPMRTARISALFKI